jgi:hypothetical protein
MGFNTIIYRYYVHLLDVSRFCCILIWRPMLHSDAPWRSSLYLTGMLIGDFVEEPLRKCMAVG